MFKVKFIFYLQRRVRELEDENENRRLEIDSLKEQVDTLHQQLQSKQQQLDARISESSGAIKEVYNYYTETTIYLMIKYLSNMVCIIYS